MPCLVIIKKIPLLPRQSLLQNSWLNRAGFLLPAKIRIPPGNRLRLATKLVRVKLIGTEAFSGVTWGIRIDPNEYFRIDKFHYVQSDPVSAVPAPPALLLFGTGLLGLIGLKSRKKAA